MKRLNIKIFSSMILLGLLAGCASNNENVAFSDKKVKKETKVDKKVSEIKTKNDKIESNDTMVKSNISEESTNSKNSKKVDSYINEVTSVINGKEIKLKSIHFGFDKYKLSGNMIDISNNNASKINNTMQTAQGMKIKLEGNCDEWGTDEYNYALGLKRTKSVKSALITNGIPSNKIVVVSYGESNPVCTAQTAKCWKQNRRVDYKLLP